MTDGADNAPFLDEDDPCWQCGKIGTDCVLMEWDSVIHSSCVEAFLKTGEGKCVLSHGHYVAIWKDGVIVELHQERTP